jgi:hypothetical protein
MVRHIHSGDSYRLRTRWVSALTVNIEATGDATSSQSTVSDHRGYLSCAMISNQAAEGTPRSVNEVPLPCCPSECANFVMWFESVAQLVEHRPFKALVLGSSPSALTINSYNSIRYLSGSETSSPSESGIQKGYFHPIGNSLP